MIRKTKQKHLTIINVQKLLPENFSRYCRKSQHNVFMIRAVEYLKNKGWKFPDIGDTVRGGRRVETGKIINLDCQNVQLWFNAINLVGSAVDLLHNYNPRYSRTYKTSASIKHQYIDNTDSIIQEYLKHLKEKEFWVKMKEKYGQNDNELDEWAKTFTKELTSV